MRIANPLYPNLRITNITPELKIDIIELAGGKSAYISDYIKRLVREDKKRKEGNNPLSLKKAS